MALASSLMSRNSQIAILRSLRFPKRELATTWFLPLAIFALILTYVANAQNPADKPPQPDINYRACLGAEKIPSCMEVRATSLAIREFFAGYVREQKWNAGKGVSPPDGWTFTRFLEKEELAQVARTDVLGGRMTWTEGKAFIEIKTSDAGDGFTRVQILTKFQGRGQTTIGFARPSDWWPLASKGTLESDMLAALQSHFSSKR